MTRGSDEMTQATQASEAAQRKAGQPGYVDFWDSTGTGMWFVHVDPTQLEGLWSEEQDTLYINLTGGSYWLSSPGEMGEDPFDTLDGAKDAGDEIVERKRAELPAMMLKDAGLDAQTWIFEYQEGARFKNLGNEALVIEIDIEDGSRSGERFTAYDGEYEIGRYGSASEAADAVVNRPAPGM